VCIYKESVKNIGCATDLEWYKKFKEVACLCTVKGSGPVSEEFVVKV